VTLDPTPCKLLIYKGGSRVSRVTSKEGERTLTSSPQRGTPFSPLRGGKKNKKKFWEIKKENIINGMMSKMMNDVMSKTKADESRELKVMVDEYLKRGGEITQIPVGVSGSEFKFHGDLIPARKFQLFGLNRNSKTRPGFHREKMWLNEKN